MTSTAVSNPFSGATMFGSQHRHYTELIAVQAWINETLPEVRRLAQSEGAPEVRFLCPERRPRDPRARRLTGGHLVRRGSLRVTPTGMVTLLDRGGPGVVEDGWAGALDRSTDNPLGQPKVRMACSKCRWTGTPAQHALLIQYLLALAHPKRECTIP